MKSEAPSSNDLFIDKGLTLLHDDQPSAVGDTLVFGAALDNDLSLLQTLAVKSSTS